MICFSFSPIADTKYPGDQSTFSFQYTFPNHANFFRNILAVLLFIRPTTSLTAYFGGMIITTCM